MKKLAVFIAAGLLVTVIVGASFWLRIRDERAHMDVLQARVAALEAAPPPPVAPPVPEPAPLPRTAPAPRPAAAPPAPAPAPPPPRAAAAAAVATAQVQEMMSGSAGRDLMRMMMQQQYPDMARELGLTDAEAAKVFDLIARQQQDIGMDSLALLGIGPTDPESVRNAQRNVEEKTRAGEAELAALLGSKYPDWQKYQATAAARQQIARIQTALGSVNALTESQSKALLPALATAQAKMAAEQRNEPVMKGNNPKEVLENQLKVAEETMRRMLDAASPHLTIAQKEIYKRSLEQDVTSLRAIMGSMGGLATPGGNVQ